jgi:hypothetical protein
LPPQAGKPVADKSPSESRIGPEASERSSPEMKAEKDEKPGEQAGHQVCRRLTMNGRSGVQMRQSFHSAMLFNLDLE